MKDWPEFFRKTGAQGGRKRAQSQTPEQRREQARLAARRRWERVRAKQEQEQQIDPGAAGGKEK